MESKARQFGGTQPNFMDLNVSNARVTGCSGTNPSMSWTSRIELLLSRVGAAEVPVLIQGETGSGKEVLARRLHSYSNRADKPFLKLNCAALPAELVESELFGYERGAFTGALQNKPGMFATADGGTLLLDEIGDMDFKLQAKLLQVLQDQEFLPLGSSKPVRVDVRVIAATHCDLEKAIADGRFREDLYYRLNVIAIQVPPLRDRSDEILILAQTLLRKHAGPDTALPRITRELELALLAHNWPGNVRELENVMRRFLVFRDPEALAEELRSKTRRIQAPALKIPAPVSSNPTPAAAESTPVLRMVEEARAQAESEAILAALRSTNWNRKSAAKLLKIDYKALLYKMKKLGIGEDSKIVSFPVGEAESCTESAEAAAARMFA